MFRCTKLLTKDEISKANRIVNRNVGWCATKLSSRGEKKLLLAPLKWCSKLFYKKLGVVQDGLRW